MQSQPPDPSPLRLPEHDDPPRHLDEPERSERSTGSREPLPPPRVDFGGLERVLSIPLTLHVELGRKRMRIAEVLELGAGQVLELEVAAGTPLSVYANGTLVAEGEAVVIGDRYGLRITQIVSPEERIARLGGKGVR